MRRRLRLGVLIAVSLVAAGYPVWQCLAPPHRITQSSVQRIRVGMTRQEVESIIGVPPGDYPPERVANITVWSNPDFFPAGWTRETWRSTDTVIAVYFDRDQKVLTFGCGSSTMESPWLGPVRRLLGL